uniref:Uncharacterized protein n=1 Tax=Meloidogyne floridensis TaxID=298350 RepID=A0A915NK48_9BILA
MAYEHFALSGATIKEMCLPGTACDIRFSIMQEPPSSWFWIKYPVLVNDFSLVIGIEKKELLRRCILKGEEGSLQILTTFGLLNALYDQEKKKREENNDENEENIIKFNINLDEEEEEGGKQKEEECCALGCFDGFKKALEKQESKMSLRCGNMIENVMQFYRG